MNWFFYHTKIYKVLFHFHIGKYLLNFALILVIKTGVWHRSEICNQDILKRVFEIRLYSLDVSCVCACVHVYIYILQIDFYITFNCEYIFHYKYIFSISLCVTTIFNSIEHYQTNIFNFKINNINKILTNVIKNIRIIQEKITSLLDLETNFT